MWLLVIILKFGYLYKQLLGIKSGDIPLILLKACQDANEYQTDFYEETRLAT